MAMVVTLAPRGKVMTEVDADCHAGIIGSGSDGNDGVVVMVM